MEVGIIQKKILKSIVRYLLIQLITNMSGDENGISKFASRLKVKDTTLN